MPVHDDLRLVVVILFGYSLTFQLVELMGNVWFQGNFYSLLAVEYVHRQLTVKIIGHCSVYDVKTCIDWCTFQRVIGKLDILVIGKIDLDVMLSRSTLYRQRPILVVNDDAMRRQYFLPFLIGKIDWRSDNILIGYSWFCRTWLCLYWRERHFQLFHWVNCSGWSLLLSTFIIKSVASC